MKKETLWFEYRHWDALAKYYNEHHDEMGKKFRNFGHWLATLAYFGFKKMLEEEK